jgi:hypothetical protein
MTEEAEPQFFDPFGANEHFITGVHREMIGTELVRLTCYATEGPDRIVKVRVLMPVAVLLAERDKTAHFLRGLRDGGRMM